MISFFQQDVRKDRFIFPEAEVASESGDVSNMVIEKLGARIQQDAFPFANIYQL